MRKKGLRVVNWAIWRPAATLMRRLRFPGKMAVIALAFLVPVLWLLGQFLQEAREDLGFVALERQGVRYAQALYPVLQASDQWRYAARQAALGGASDPVPAARAAFDQAHAALALQQQSLAEVLNTGAAWQAVQQRLSQAQGAASGDPQAIYAAMNPLSQALTDLLAEVTDQSGLALDPEMGSYYLMSGVLMRAPEIIRRTGELRGLAGGALRTGQMDAQQATRLVELRALLAQELKAARSDMEKARASLGALGPRLTLETHGATQAYLQALEQRFPPGQPPVPGDAATLVALANRTLETQYHQASSNLAVLDEALAQRERHLLGGLWLALGTTAASLLLAVFLAMGFYRSMFGGFKALRRHLMAISMGDLRTEIDGRGRDEVGDLLREVGYMQESLRQTVSQVQSASDSVVQASLEIAEGTNDLSARTEAAAAALEQSSAALEETTSSVAHTAQSAKQAADISVDNARVAERGGAVMQQMVQTMENIQQASRRINDIIGVIDGIAFQTNILALNAAVEAARAGEQGRGFAVVAGEVRNLAQRSAEAAKEIKDLISSSVSQVDSGMHVVRDAGQTMQEIVSHADQVRQLLDEVAGGAREQSLGISQVGQAVQDLDQNTQANAALVEQTAAAASAQRTAAVRMAAQVDEFRLPGARTQASLVEGIDVDAMIDAHRQWKVRLRDAIEGHERVDAQTLSRDDCCALGKWIHGDGQRLGGRPAFIELIERHRRFHQVAGSVGELINRRRYREAEDALAPGTPFSGATSDVVLVLSSAKRLGF
jgi:methyl-accepting chemotaxis protein